MGVTLGPGVPDGVGVGVALGVAVAVGEGVGVGADVELSCQVSLKCTLFASPPKRITWCRAASYVIPAPSRAGGECGVNTSVHVAAA